MAEEWLKGAVDAVDKVSSMPEIQQAITNAKNISRALAILGKLNADFKGIYNGWETEQLETKVTQGIDIQVQILNLVAIYVPGVAVAAEAMAIVEVLMPMLIMLGRAIEKSPHFQELEKRIIADGIKVPQGGWVPKEWGEDGSGMHYNPATGVFEKRKPHAK